MQKKKRQTIGLRPDGRRRHTERNMQIEKKFKNIADDKGNFFFLLENTE